MITIKSPFRISFFGGSTDYKDFYEQSGSFIIGTTIDKYIYLSMRHLPKLLLKNNESRLSYSKTEIVESLDQVQNPLIRETLRYKQVGDPVELVSFVDMPSRTGLGGSSSYCVGLIHIIDQLYGKKSNKKTIAKEAIHIERNILKESGGIQDQVWASYGGLNSIEIHKDGNFAVRPIPVTEDFKDEFEKSLILIYTNDQRHQDDIPQSHENKDKTNILKLSYEAYNHFIKEDIKEIGKLMYTSWMEKNKISTLISSSKINSIINRVMELGAYGTKLLGSGGCGFVLVICDPIIKEKIQKEFSHDILDVRFEYDGVKEIYRSL